MRKPSEPIIYNRIAMLRAERGLSRQDLAQALGISYQDLGYLELDAYNPDLDLAFRISEYFGLPIESIFARQPFKPSNEERYGRNVIARAMQVSPRIGPQAGLRRFYC